MTSKEAPGPAGMIGWFFGGLLLVFVAWAAIKGATTDDGRDQARAAIKMCWEEQRRASHAPAEARFAAGACEMMERDFEGRYGVRP